MTAHRSTEFLGGFARLQQARQGKPRQTSHTGLDHLATDTVVLFNTATGLKYPMPAVTSLIDKNADIDYSRFT